MSFEADSASVRHTGIFVIQEYNQFINDGLFHREHEDERRAITIR